MQREKRIFRHMILIRDQRMVIVYEQSYLRYSFHFNIRQNYDLSNLTVKQDDLSNLILLIFLPGNIYFNRVKGLVNSSLKIGEL